MNARELTLNIAVNLGRIGRLAYEGRVDRLHQFLEETEEYVRELEKSPKSPRFEKTFNNFKEDFTELKNDARLDALWAEMIFTWANILTHRAQLA
ncbi:MAG: hypothetical protein A2987_02630 [Omnitrophica bacterium RIFCSPLOWO2_01_FULL_45_10]|nr:MAG: hypothetical protein A2987_02630 [Omnitrophica bacterium RIFCSPLOWO2_01_FULL_45_10]